MKLKRNIPAVVGYLPTILVFALIAVIFVIAVSDMGSSSEAEAAAITEKNIRRAVISCYAQEGSYPESIDYLVENYGLYISDEYFVQYDLIGSNIMPEIFVTRKRADE